MRKLFLSFLALASVFVWVACDTGQPLAPGDVEASFAIGDAAHDAANFPGFYWLPPMVANPQTTGVFDGTLLPTLKIVGMPHAADPDVDPLTHDICAATVPWTFDRTSGPAGHRVGVDVHGGFYHMNWDTDDLSPDPGDYRISVCLGKVRIGFADLLVGSTGKDFTNSRTDETIGLIDGRVLPIKFRIEDGVMESFDIAYHSNSEANTTEVCEYMGIQYSFNTDVFLMDRVRGLHVNITNSPGSLDFMPSWSPDGERIVFASDRDNSCGPPDLYVMNVDGTDVTRLTTEGGWWPEFSPDGNRIVFQRGWPHISHDEYLGMPDADRMVGREHDIYVINADGSGERKLTDVGHGWDYDPFEDWQPTWHPDGELVTFARSHNAFTGHEVLPPAECPRHPSPDPDKLGFPIWEDPNCFGHFNLVSLNVNDPNEDWTRHTVTWMRDEHLHPRWSPDGDGLAFTNSDRTLFALDPAPMSSDEWFGMNGFEAFKFLAPESQNPSWSSSGEVVFGSSRHPNTFGAIFYVDDWEAWVLGATPFIPGDPPTQPGNSYSTGGYLFGAPSDLTGGARFRPTH